MLMTALKNSTRVGVAPAQVSCSLDKESVILNLANGTYYGLNPVGAAVWELLREPRTVESIQQEIRNAYEVEAERADADVLALLEQLLAAGLIQVNDQPHP